MPYLFIMQLKICYEIHMRKNTTAYVNSYIEYWKFLTVWPLTESHLSTFCLLNCVIYQILRTYLQSILIFSMERVFTCNWSLKKMQKTFLFLYVCFKDLYVIFDILNVIYYFTFLFLFSWIRCILKLLNFGQILRFDIIIHDAM